MNRYLMAGCAAVALAMGSGAAHAQTKFEVRIGGDAYFEAGYVDQDNDANLRDTEFRNRFRLNIVPSAKADNGLEYGGRLRIRASNDTTTAPRNMDADRALIFVAGTFGRVELGTRNSYNDDAYTNRPQDYQFLGIYDSPVSWAGSNTNVTAATVKLSSLSFGNLPSAGGATAQDDVESRIVYISPRFAGFQLGASYAPRSGGVDSGAVVNRAQGDSSLQDVYEIGLTYKGEFSGVTLAGSFGYVGGEYENSSTLATATRYEDLNGIQAGVQIGYAGFVLGGGYNWFGDSGLAKFSGARTDDYEVWNVGLQYTTGPFVIGVGFTQGTDSGTVITAASGGDRTQDYYSVGASYTVAPGLRVQAEYAYIELENEDIARGTAGRQVDNNVVILRSVLQF